MPLKSKAQQRLMYAAAEGTVKDGPSATVAKEYIAGTPKSAYSKLPETAKRKVAVKRK